MRRLNGSRGGRAVTAARPPRIAILLPFPLNHKGGISTFIAGLCEGLRGRTAVELVLIAPDRFRAGPKQRLSQLALAVQQFGRLLQVRPDIVHTHEHPVLLAVAIAYRTVAGRPLRVVHTAHVDPIERQMRWKRVLLGRLMDRCWAVTSVSRDTARRLGHIATPVPPGVRVVHGGADLQVRQRDDPAVEAFRASIDLGRGPVVCQMGPMNFPRKVEGVLHLVEAFGLVRTQFRDAQLVLVGDGALRADVEAACNRAGVADAVRITGYIDDVSLPLTLADVYCQITLQDACPLSLLEAMLSAKAVVATRTGGIPEIISDEIDGILVDTDPRQIARAIIGLLERPEEREALGARAAATARARFSWERVAAEFAAVYGLPGAAGWPATACRDERRDGG